MMENKFTKLVKHNIRNDKFNYKITKEPGLASKSEHAAVETLGDVKDEDSLQTKLDVTSRLIKSGHKEILDVSIFIWNKVKLESNL